MEIATQNNGLNPVQQSLLRIFNRPMTIEEANDIKKIFFNYYSDKLFEEVDRVVAEKGITEADYEALRNDHWRTKKIK